MVGGFRVVCNLNTLVMDRVILGYIYFYRIPFIYCASQSGDVVNQLERLLVVDWNALVF